MNKKMDVKCYHLGLIMQCVFGCSVEVSQEMAEGCFLSQCTL